MNKLTEQEKKNLLADLVAGILAAIVIAVFFWFYIPTRAYGMAEQDRIRWCPDEVGQKTVCAEKGE